MAQLTTDGPVQRPSVRVLPVNLACEVLLLLVRDPLRPNETYWLTIGGGVDPGESLIHCAVRELHEETGIQVAGSQLVGPFLRTSHAFSYAGRDYISDSTFFAVAVEGVTSRSPGSTQTRSATSSRRAGGTPTTWFPA